MLSGLLDAGRQQRADAMSRWERKRDKVIERARRDRETLKLSETYAVGVDQAFDALTERAAAEAPARAAEAATALADVRAAQDTKTAARHGRTPGASWRA